MSVCLPVYTITQKNNLSVNLKLVAFGNMDKSNIEPNHIHIDVKKNNFLTSNHLSTICK